VTAAEKNIRLAIFYVSSAVFILGIGSLIAGARHFIPPASTCGAGCLACSAAAAVWRRTWLTWAAWVLFAGIIVFFFAGNNGSFA
jgi:hypothetical protein